MPIGPDVLRTIARQAVSEHLTDGTDLTTSVVKAASAFGATSLTSEHVRRICEMTYHDAYERKYRENTGSQDRYVTFDPPDAAAAAYQLQAAKVASYTSRRTEMTQTEQMGTKTASAPPRRFDVQAAQARAVSQAFEVSGQEKIAWENPTREVMALKTELKEAVNSLEVQEASAGSSAKFAMYDLLAKAEQECKEGLTVGEVLYACVSAGGTKVAEAVLNPLVHDLAAHLVRKGYRSELGEKTASFREVNAEHPLPQAFLNVANLRSEQEKAAGALIELRGEYTHLCSRIRNELGR